VIKYIEYWIYKITKEQARGASFRIRGARGLLNLQNTEQHARRTSFRIRGARGKISKLKKIPNSKTSRF